MDKHARRLQALAIFFVAAAIAGGCSPKTPPGGTMPPDVYPLDVDVSVSLHVFPDAVTLGPRSTRRFLEMLGRNSIHTEISMMPAAPLGEFRVGDATYYWHGNAVIRGRGEEERLWSGTFTQRLINDFTEQDPETVDEFRVLLAKIEADPNIESITVEGPGAYPGTPDALHPIPFSEFEVFKPDPKPEGQ